MFNEESKISLDKNLIIPGLLVETKFPHNSKWVTNIVESVNTDIITIPLVQDYFKENSLIEDTIQIEFVDSEHQFKIDGKILNIDVIGTQTISIKVLNFFTYKNKRKSIRHYINLGANVKTPFEDNLMAIVTNVSKTGVCFVTKWDLEIGTEIKIDILLSLNEIISFKGKIVRMNPVPFGFEHAIEFDDDPEINKNVNKIIKGIEDETTQLRDSLYKKFSIYLKRSSKSFFNLKIMLVDNSHLVRMIVKGAINNAGITNVYEASDSFEALDKIKESKPDIVVLSYIICEVENKNIIDNIIDAYPEIKIVILSSTPEEKASPELTAKIKKYNIDFIPKSFSCDKLIEIIKGY